MKLVDEVEHAWRWFSLQAMALAAAVEEGWAQFPEDWKASILAHTSPNTIHHIVVGLLALGIVGRLVKQAPRSSNGAS